ncbi:peptidoglycan-binding domain-containing protein [Streptomyces sp. AK04-3B]|uniref:peptidoglycan-binding domain-containing protein n=1 Tax=unclassified Streptomyces TaxID=2593676 RepID=UPI0029AE6DB3|nr:peptidoglycan-binding domain-containing protein [Streptomyces sp. AK04-3B]MDX3803382.1 peptidoglycan-binding domain-containing protein [Streptomyces sp. AK04-3B]
MSIRKRIALATAALALGSGFAVPPAAAASAATYTCHYSTSGEYAYAGYYSGTTVQPSSTVVTNSGIEAQCLLRRSGFNPGTIDGVFGSNSKAAAKNMQAGLNECCHAGLDEDGKIGRESWPWLRRLAHL